MNLEKLTYLSDRFIYFFPALTVYVENNWAAAVSTVKLFL